MVEKKTRIESIDLTPEWCGILPICFSMLEDKAVKFSARAVMFDQLEILRKAVGVEFQKFADLIDAIAMGGHNVQRERARAGAKAEITSWAVELDARNAAKKAAK